MEKISKICKVCGKLKGIENFHKKYDNLDGHRNECKECVKNIQRKYKEAEGFKEKTKKYDKKRYNENREKILERKREYHVENREKILKKKLDQRNDPKNKEKNKDWRKNNKERLAKLQSEYRRKYPHIIAWRSILYSTLKRLNTPKQDKTIELLGYSALELKNHIEKQFLSGMTWENHGEWHIDHRLAVSNFDSNTPMNEVCSLSNLQPLWAFDNISKGNR